MHFCAQMHLVKNMLMDRGAFDAQIRVPLILGIWGGKGQGAQAASLSNCVKHNKGASSGVRHYQRCYPPLLQARPSRQSWRSRSWGELSVRHAPAHHHACKHLFPISARAQHCSVALPLQRANIFFIKPLATLIAGWSR